jgi:RNA polymerase sigma-70 factor (ECF subfamily)
VSPGELFGDVSAMMMTMTPRDTELYREHADELIRYATVLVGPDDASDVVVDAVLAAFGSPGWRNVAHPRAYLFRTVLNTANSRHRSTARRRRREVVVGTRAVVAPAMTDDTAIDVHRALATISPQQRAIVYLAYWEDLTAAQIAATLDISEGAVRKQLARARARLRKVIDHA